MTDRESGRLSATTVEEEYELLLEELEEVRADNRRLQDQLKKTTRAAGHAERSAAEAARAHAKMVETLTETMRENTALTIERDMWKSRAHRVSHSYEHVGTTPIYDVRESLGVMHITPEEVRAIRKAIARLHHPDAGGDLERMKMWNASLDQLEGRL